MKKFILRDKKSVCLYLCYLVLGIIFFFCIGNKKYVMYADSYNYIDLSKCTNLLPIYPLFISLNKYFFGEIIYLQAVFVEQSIFAMGVSILFSDFLKKTFNHSILRTLIIYILTFLPYGYSLPQEVSTHQILTEGLTFPLFYLYFLFLLYWVFSKKISGLFMTFPVMLILMLIRYQFFYLVIINVLVGLYIFIENHKKNINLLERDIKKKWTVRKKTVVFFSGILFSVIIGCSFKYLASSISPHLTGMLMGKVLYVAQPEDEKFFDSDEMKNAYKYVYQAVDDGGIHLKYAREGLYKWKDIMEASRNHDIGSEALWNYYETEYKITDINVLTGKVVRAKTEIVYQLFLHEFGRYLWVILLQLPQCFICTVFIQKENYYLLCHIITLFLYLAAMLINLASYKVQKNDKRIAVFLSMVLVTNCVSILSLCFIFFGIQRYLVYTFGLFYVAMFLTVMQLYDVNRIKRKK